MSKLDLNVIDKMEEKIHRMVAKHGIENFMLAFHNASVCADIFHHWDSDYQKTDEKVFKKWMKHINKLLDIASI